MITTSYLKHLSITTFCLSLFCAALSCQKSACPEPAPVAGRFSLVLEEADGNRETKSILQSADIETRITSVTLGLYIGGVLAEKEYYASGFDEMTFPLEDGTYIAYALVNMGDMRSALPVNESDIASVTYSIPGYLDNGTGIEFRGIPMAGKLPYTVGITQSGAIPVRRLMAKVTAVMNCNWSGKISAVKVYNLNRTLKPFGSSAAASTADILPVQEFQAGSGSPSGSFVFYVPENMQGSISGIEGSTDKSPEGNTTVNHKKDLLTYLETLVEGTGDVEGSITYRSYLGDNATTNFDICRNWRYTWNLTFLPDGRLNNDWKHENHLAWSEYRYDINQTALYLYKGERVNLTVWRYEDRYIEGVKKAGAGTNSLFTNRFQWSSDQPDIASAELAGTLLYVEGKGNGTCRITATGPDGSADATLYCDVTAMNYKRQLFLLSDPGPRSVVGETVYLKALVYTTQNGTVTGPQDVTGQIFDCSIFRASYDGSSNPVYVPSQGVVKATAAGSERFSASYSHVIDHKTIHANGLYIDFETAKTGELSITGTTTAHVGQSVPMTAVFTPYSGGVAQPGSAVTARWNIQDGGPKYHVTDFGVVTADEPGATVVQATYSSNGLTYRAQVVVLFNS